MFSSILAAFAAIPKIISVLELIAKGISDLVEAQRTANFIAKEQLASAKAVATKDTSDLENVFKGGK